MFFKKQKTEAVIPVYEIEERRQVEEPEADERKSCLNCYYHAEDVELLADGEQVMRPAENVCLFYSKSTEYNYGRVDYQLTRAGRLCKNWTKKPEE